MKETTTWMLVSNATQARIFKLDQKPRDWVLVKSLEHAASRAHDHDLVTDRAGRMQHQSRGGTSGSGLERTSPHREEAHRFARELARELEAGAGSHQYDRLVVIAPPKLLGLLLREMTPVVRSRLAMQLPRDYVALSADQLEGHVRHATGRTAVSA